MLSRLLTLSLAAFMLTHCGSVGQKAATESTAKVSAPRPAGSPKPTGNSSVFVIDLATALRLAGAENLDVRNALYRL